MKKLRWVVLGFLLVGIALAPFFLRSFVEAHVILPLAHLLWQLDLIYHAIPQELIWAVVLATLISITLGSFVWKRNTENIRARAGHRRRGEVEQLSFWIKRRAGSNYSQWQIANLLANIALDILQQRSGAPLRDPRLEGPGWQPPPEIQEYLTTALKTSFADYPRPGLFSSQPSTPFSREVEPVVAYLESLLENSNDHHHS